MRIIAGRHRGRRLEAPPGQAVRPTSARAREAVYDILAHGRFADQPVYEDARVLDAFAGTGAMGLEALSRGARFATFMEKDRDARTLLTRAVAALGETERAAILAGDAIRPPRSSGPCDLIFLDPPYDAPIAAASLAALDAGGWVAKGALAVVETRAGLPFDPPPMFALLDDRRYGAARILFLRREG